MNIHLNIIFLNQVIHKFKNLFFKGTIRTLVLEAIEHEHSLLESKVRVKKDKIFVRQCPNNDCRGFLNVNLYCDLCKVIACNLLLYINLFKRYGL